MTEKYEDANSIISDLESQMARANLIKRGEYAAGIAVLAGAVLKSALEAGVPYALAEEMAGDFWKAEMLADTVAGLLRNAEVEEDDE
ncbi:hypothetical protein ACFYY2_12395 [Streptomyces sp. NPDC001822]|uniref:hypothetical protein n=1 Tax=Streptomyces sp. NPDC001822 TaxID=3364614 RepID=UPI00369133AA